MSTIITNDDIKAFDVANKFGFLNISDSEDEEETWQKPKKPAKQPTSAGYKKKAAKSNTPALNSSVVGMNAAPSQNIITTQPGQGQGLSKNAKRRARKKKQAEVGAAEEGPGEAPTPDQTEEEKFQKQLDAAMSLSKREDEKREQQAIDQMVETERQENPPQKSTKKKKKITIPVAANGDAEKEGMEEDEEEEADLFVPVIEDIKDVIKRISKEDEIPITEIPIDNNQLLRKRAIELQEINSEFKQKLNSLLRVGYKYKRKYQNEKETNKMLTKVLGRCESSKKSDMVKTILQHEDTEQMMTKQIEELLEELEKERTKLHAHQGEKKNATVKKVSFSSDQ